MNEMLDLKEKRIDVENIYITLDKITEWQRDNGFLHSGNILYQLGKLTEELGEFASEIIKENYEKAEMEGGDIIAVLNSILNMIKSNIPKAADMAYNKIKDRTENTKNGVFIKD